MNASRWAVVGFCVSATLPFAASAQGTAASAPLPAASTPVAPKAGPKLLSPRQLRESGSAVDDQQLPEGKAVPQISLPLGKAQPTLPSSKPRSTRAATSPASGGVGDAAARCEAEADAAARAACRDRAAHSR